jgi:hypothetical protein
MSVAIASSMTAVVTLDRLQVVRCTAIRAKCVETLIEKYRCIGRLSGFGNSMK